jgi:hypothetical protein
LLIGGSYFISPFVIPENVELDYKLDGYDGGPNMDPTAGGSSMKLLNLGG